VRIFVFELMHAKRCNITKEINISIKNNSNRGSTIIAYKNISSYLINILRNRNK